MERIFIQCSALTVCAAATLALLAACDNDSKKIVTPPITPKFLYASSCGTASAKAAATARRRHPQNGVAHASPNIVGTGGVDGYSVDPTTGALTALTGSPVATGMSCPEFLTTDPGQKFLFVPDESDDQIHAFTIGTTGALTEVTGSPYSVQCVFQLAVDPSGKYLVAPDFCSTNIYVYSIGSDGSLTAVAGSPFAETSGNEPESVFIDPSGQWVYVVDSTDGPGTISAFALSSAGALTEITGSPFTTGVAPYAIAGTPDGKYLYTNDQSGTNQIDAFSVDSTTGALTALSTPSFPGGSCWNSVDASGKVVFSTDCNGNVFASAINSDGSLTAATGSPFTAGTGSWPVTGDPSGMFVYAGDDTSTGQIFAYTYTSAGVLTAVSGSPIASGTYIEGIVVTH